MATITSNGTGGGDWGATATWSGGVVPVATDSVIIPSGDTVTINDASTAKRCVTVDVDGTLDIDVDHFHCDNMLGNFGGRYKMVGGGTLRVADLYDAAMDASLEFEGTGSGDFWTLEFVPISTATQRIVDGGSVTIKLIYGKIKFISGSLAAAIWFRTYNNNLEVRDVEFSGFVHLDLAFSTYSMGTSPWRRLFFKDCGAIYVKQDQSQGQIVLEECYFGYNLDGTITGAIGTSSAVYFSNGANVIMRNCYYNQTDSPGWLLIQSGNYDRHAIVMGADGDQDQWYSIDYDHSVERSASYAKTDPFGFRLAKHVSTQRWPTHAYLTVQIPVDSGDSVSPTVYIRINSPSSAFSGAAGSTRFTLDPSNEWGLYEVKEPNYATEDAWQLISFTGGTVGGTGKSGFLVIRFELYKYVASATIDVSDFTVT